MHSTGNVWTSLFVRRLFVFFPISSTLSLATMTSVVETKASTTTLPAFTEGTVYLRMQELEESKDFDRTKGCPFRVMTYASPAMPTASYTIQKGFRLP